MKLKLIIKFIGKTTCHREKPVRRCGDPISNICFSGLLRRFTPRNDNILTLLLICLVIISTLFSFSSIAKEKNYKRIVSLKPNITELLFELGVGDKIVGVTTWCDKPTQAKKIEKVADYISPNVEKILALKPDIVIGSVENSIKRPVQLLEENGIKTVLLPFYNIENLIDSTEKLAKIIGKKEAGLKLTTKWKQLLKKKNETQKKQNVLIIVGKRPMVAAGKSTIIGEIASLAGLNNITGSSSEYPHISIETVITKDPDIIIDLSMGSEETNIKAVDKFWSKYPISAMKNHKIYALNISDFRPGPNLIDRIEEIRKLVEK